MELKPCPFCLTTLTRVVNDLPVGYGYRVLCHNCGAFGPGACNEEVAAANWNAPPAAPSLSLPTQWTWPSIGRFLEAAGAELTDIRVSHRGVPATLGGKPVLAIAWRPANAETTDGWPLKWSHELVDALILVRDESHDLAMIAGAERLLAKLHEMALAMPPKRPPNVAACEAATADPPPVDAAPLGYAMATRKFDRRRYEFSSNVVEAACAAAEVKPDQPPGVEPIDYTISAFVFNGNKIIPAADVKPDPANRRDDGEIERLNREVAKSLARHFGFYPPLDVANPSTAKEGHAIDADVRCALEHIVENSKDPLMRATCERLLSHPDPEEAIEVVDEFFARKGAAPAPVAAEPKPDVDEKEAMRAFFGDPTA